jgi:hypothetical protein
VLPSLPAQRIAAFSEKILHTFRSGSAVSYNPVRHSSACVERLLRIGLVLVCSRGTKPLLLSTTSHALVNGGVAPIPDERVVVHESSDEQTATGAGVAGQSEVGRLTRYLPHPAVGRP